MGVGGGGWEWGAPGKEGDLHEQGGGWRSGLWPLSLSPSPPFFSTDFVNPIAPPRPPPPPPHHHHHRPRIHRVRLSFPRPP